MGLSSTKVRETQYQQYGAIPSFTSLGGAYTVKNVTATILMSKFTKNKPSFGGTIYLAYSHVTIQSSNFVNNTARFIGGVIFSHQND